MRAGQAQRLGALLALALCACAGKQPKPDEPPVKSLKFEGTKAVSPGDIEEHILTTGPSWWPFASTPYFDPIAGRPTCVASSATTRLRASTRRRW
jgi:hypothetical protein